MGDLHPFAYAKQAGKFSLIDLVGKKAVISSDVANNLKSGLSKRLFIKHFNEMLVEKPKMKRFIEELTKKTSYRFMLLSNTNSLHWQYVKKNFPYVMSLGTFELSYNLKLYKPDIRVYTTVIKKHKLI